MGDVSQGRSVLRILGEHTGFEPKFNTSVQIAPVSPFKGKGRQIHKTLAAGGDATAPRVLS